jgi:hypothetical protein
VNRNYDWTEPPSTLPPGWEPPSELVEEMKEEAEKIRRGSVTKELLREALARNPNNDEFEVFKVRGNSQVWDAARRYERLIPGECPSCGGKGQTHDNPDCYACTCEACQGTGKVWDEGLVEAVAKAIWRGLGFTERIEPTEGNAVFDASSAALAALFNELEAE